MKLHARKTSRVLRTYFFVSLVTVRIHNRRKSVYDVQINNKKKKTENDEICKKK